MLSAIVACARAGETEPEAIAIALRRRDSGAVGGLVVRYHYRLLRYLVYLTGRREAAEDLVQDTWMRVLDRASQYDGRGRFEPWLFSIARNLAIDHLRREGRGAIDSPGEEAEQEMPDGAESPFTAAARNEDAARVAGAMDHLPPAYRESLLLRFQEELSLEEISQVAGAPVSTVASRIRRGLAILRAELEGERHDG